VGQHVRKVVHRWLVSDLGVPPPPVVVAEALVDDGLQVWQRLRLDDPRACFGLHPAPEGLNPRVVLGAALG